MGFDFRVDFLMTKRVLFVCLGNICRSPAAEAVAAHLVAARNLAIEVDSAGTIDAHAGRPPDRRMKAAGESRGYQFVTRARQVTGDDLLPGRFDLIIAMDRENLRDIRRLSNHSTEHVKLFGDFLQQSPAPDVPDPYYGGPAGFETVLDMLEAGCPHILTALTAKTTDNSDCSD